MQTRLTNLFVHAARFRAQSRVNNLRLLPLSANQLLAAQLGRCVLQLTQFIRILRRGTLSCLMRDIGCHLLALLLGVVVEINLL